MKKILKNIIPPAIVVAGASTIIATSATSCGTKSIEVNTTIDVYYDLSNNVWQTVENTYSEKRVIDDYNIIVTTIANKKPIGTYVGSVRMEMNEQILANLTSIDGNVGFNNEHIQFMYLGDDYCDENANPAANPFDLSLQIKGIKYGALPSQIIVKCWGTKDYYEAGPILTNGLILSNYSWQKLELKINLNEIDPPLM